MDNIKIIGFFFMGFGIGVFLATSIFKKINDRMVGSFLNLHDLNKKYIDNLRDRIKSLQKEVQSKDIWISIAKEALKDDIQITKK